MGGLLVNVLVQEVGLEAVAAHLYGAPEAAWEAACRAAGTTAAAVERAFRRRIAGP